MIFTICYVRFGLQINQLKLLFIFSGCDIVPMNFADDKKRRLLITNKDTLETKKNSSAFVLIQNLPGRLIDVFLKKGVFKMSLKKIMKKIGKEVSRFGHSVEKEIRRTTRSLHRIAECELSSSPEYQALCQLRQQQEEIQRRLQELEQERQRRLAYIKEKALNLVAATRKNFLDAIVRDSALLKETEDSLQKNRLAFQARDAKLKRMEDAMLAFEAGDISKIESVSQDVEIRALFPNLDHRIFEMAARAGKIELVRLLEVRKSQEKLKALGETAEAHFSRSSEEAVQKDSGGDDEQVQAKEQCIRKLYREGRNSKAEKELKEIKRSKEYKEFAEHYPELVPNLVKSSNDKLEDRVSAKIAFDITFKNLFNDDEPRNWKYGDRFEYIKSEHQRLIKLFKEIPDPNTLLHDSLSCMVDSILQQLRGDYEYHSATHIEVGILLASLAVYKAIKGKVPEDQLESFIKAALIAGIARSRGNFAIYSALKYRSFSISDRIYYSEEVLERSGIDSVLARIIQFCAEAPSERGSIFTESFQTYHDKPFSRFRPKWKNLVKAYLEVMESNSHPLGDPQILMQAKDIADAKDFETRKVFQEKILKEKSIIGKIVFESYLNGEVDIIRLPARTAQSISKSHYKLKDLYTKITESQKPLYLEHDKYSEIVERALGQVIPLAYLNPNYIDYKFDLWPVAFALAKYKVLEVIDRNLSEAAILRLVKAAIVSGFARKFFSDFHVEPHPFRCYQRYWDSNMFPNFSDTGKFLHFESGYGKGFEGGFGYKHNFISYLNYTISQQPQFLTDEKESEALLHLYYVPFLDRDKKINSHVSIVQLKQTDLLQSYLNVIAQDELPSVFDARISREALKTYKEIEAIRNTETELATNRRLLESLLYELCKKGYSFGTYSEEKLREECIKVYRTYYIEKNAELEKYEPAIEAAQNIFQQIYPDCYDKNNLRDLLLPLMQIGISQALGSHNQSMGSEDSTLTKALLFIAIARQLYDRQISEFCYSNLYDFRNFYEWIIEQIAAIHSFLSYNGSCSLLDTDFNIEHTTAEILKISRLAPVERSNYLSKLYNDRHAFAEDSKPHCNKNTSHYLNLVYLYNSCSKFSDLVAEYRKVGNLSHYPAGDPRILAEAKRRVENEKGHGDGASLALSPFTGSTTRIVYPWELRAFGLKDFGRAGRIISMELEALMSPGSHPIFWSLKNKAFDELSLLGSSMVKEIFLSDRTIADPTRQPIPTKLGQIMPLNFGTEQQFRLLPGHLYKMEAWYKEGHPGQVEQYFFVPNISFLFSVLRSHYQQGMSYRLRFRGFITGSLSLQQGSFTHTQYFSNTSWTDFTPPREGAGTLKISIENCPHLNIKKEIVVKPQTKAQYLKKSFSEIDDSYLKKFALSSEIQGNETDGSTFKDTIFYISNEKFAKIDYKGGLKLWREPSQSQKTSKESETSNDQDKTKQQKYLDRYLKSYLQAKHFLNGGYSKERLSKAILSSLCLLAQDLTFGPFFALGCALYDSNSSQTIDRYLDLLAKQIALFELMHGSESEQLTAEEIAAFVEECSTSALHSHEFPDYWSYIFRETHSISEDTVKGFYLLIIQTYLTVFKGESITLNTEILSQLAEFLFGLRKEENFARLSAAMEECFKEVPGFWAWQAAIHSKWSEDLGTWEDFLTEIQEMRVAEEEHFGTEQIDIASHYGRYRSQNFDAASQVIFQYLQEAYARQARLEAEEIFFTEKRTEIQQMLKEIQQIIANYVEQLRNHQEAIEDAKRHARKKKRRMMIKMLVGLAIGAFLGPILAEAVAIGLAQMSTSLVVFQASISQFLTPIISSIVSTGIQGGDVGRAALFSTLSGGLNIGLNGILEAFPIISDSLREAIAIGGSSVIVAAVRGAKFSAVLGEGIGAGLVHYCLSSGRPSQPSDQIGRVLSHKEITRQFATDFGKMMLRPVVQSAISDVVQGRRAYIDPLAPVSGLAQGIAGAVGHKVQQRIQDSKRDPHPRVLEDKNSKSSSKELADKISGPSKKSRTEKTTKGSSTKHSSKERNMHPVLEEPAIGNLTRETTSPFAANSKNIPPSADFFAKQHGDTFTANGTSRRPSETNAHDLSPMAHIQAGPRMRSKQSEPKKVNKVAFGAGVAVGLGAGVAVGTADAVAGTFELLHSSAELIDDPKYLAKVERERAKQIQAIKKDPVGVGKAILNGISQKANDFGDKVQKSYAAGEGFQSGFILGEGLGEVIPYFAPGAGLARAGVKVAQQTARGARNAIAIASSVESFLRAGRTVGRAVTSRQGLMLSGTLATGGSLMFASPNAEACSHTSQAQGVSPAAVAIGAAALGLTAYSMSKGKIPPFNIIRPGGEIRKLRDEFGKTINSSPTPLGLVGAGAPHASETAFAGGMRQAAMHPVEPQPTHLMFRDITKEPATRGSYKSGRNSGTINQSHEAEKFRKDIAAVEAWNKLKTDSKFLEQTAGRKLGEKDVLSSKALQHPVSLTNREMEIIDKWTIERLQLLARWERQDLFPLNKDMEALLNKCKNQLRDHMTPNDLAAIFKENRGHHIFRADGKRFEHFQLEWGSVENSFAKAFKGPWTGTISESQILKQRFGEMSGLLVRFNLLIERGKCTKEVNKLTP